jgi:ABC-type enterochelin transport system ATPase subunit
MMAGLKRNFLRRIRILQLVVFWRAEFSADSVTENQSIYVQAEVSCLSNFGNMFLPESTGGQKVTVGSRDGVHIAGTLAADTDWN